MTTTPAYAMCAFDPDNPFAPCDDTIGTLEYPKTPDEIIPAPLKQMNLGIKLGHIICDPDKYPVWNIHYKPACVYPDSEGELLTRGWAKLRLLLPAGPDPIKELEVMGQNVFSLRILGNYIVGDEKYPLSYDRKRELAWEYSQQYHPEQTYLEYAITPHQNSYNVGDKIQLDLLEWGNYSDCWNLKLKIIDVKNNPVYEDNSVKYCLEPDGKPGTFHSYSIGEDFREFVCERPGYYRIEVSNGKIFSPDILENFVCLENKPEPEPNPFTVGIPFDQTFQYKDLELYFYDIEDSRCPLDVTCVWEGEVTVMIHVRNQTHKIAGYFTPGYTISYITPYNVTLVDIQPHPISTEKPDYIATLEITTLDDDVFAEPMKNAVFDKGLGHYDYLPINDNPNMMAMEKIELQNGNSINIEFGQNNYEWSTGYKPIPEFEYNANFKVNDTFVVLCTNIGKDGYADVHPDLSKPYLPGLGIVKYLGPITVENEPLLLFWHESASIQVDMPCSYPEMIHHSINLWQLQEHGLPTDNLVNALGSNYQN